MRRAVTRRFCRACRNWVGLSGAMCGSTTAGAPAILIPSACAKAQWNWLRPTVFAAAIDPVGAGLVASLARPGGNATGFTMFEYGVSAKWLELLKEISPGVKR